MDLSLDDLKDCPTTKREVFGYIMKHNEQGNIRVIFCPLNNDFAAFKNNLKKHCVKDWIFFIDADEEVTQDQIHLIREIIEMNPKIECFLVPRINTVSGLTQEHIRQWRWKVNEEGWINWPDYQFRIMKNKPQIHWDFSARYILIISMDLDY